MKSATTVRRVVLSIIGVFITVGVTFGLAAAASKPTVAAPTITSTPANPTSTTTATFVFTGPAGATLQCQLDSTPAFAVCTSPKVYAGPLAQGSHTFRVKAVVASAQSEAASYTWTVDSVAPPVPSITVKPVALSTTTSPSFSFTDTESGVTFNCKLDGSAYAACTSPRSYSNLTQGAHTFSLQAVDAAGNVSGATSWSWSIDSIAPPAPVITTKPSDPTSNATNTFAWTWSGSAPDTIQCSVENGAWFPCTSPYTYVIATTNNQQHQFAVRAVDIAGNASVSSYQFKYVKGLPTSGVPFTITGSVSGLTLGTYKPILVTITNPNSVTIHVSALAVAVSANSTPTGCLASTNVDLVQSNISTALTVAVPANGSVALPSQGAIAPQIRLKNLPTVNQDVCKGASFTLTYTGSATN